MTDLSNQRPPNNDPPPDPVIVDFNDPSVTEQDAVELGYNAAQFRWMKALFDTFRKNGRTGP